MGDYIALGLIMVIVAGAVIYLVRQKKNGVKCIGCPAGCKACRDKKENSYCCYGCSAQQAE